MTPRGTIFVSGGDCPDAACDIVFHKVFLQLEDFELGGQHINGATVANHGEWSGTKFSNNRFRVRSGLYNLVGTAHVEGHFSSMIGWPEQPIEGDYVRTGPEPHMTIVGEFKSEDGKTQVKLDPLYIPLLGRADRDLIRYVRLPHVGYLWTDSYEPFTPWVKKEWNYEWSDADGKSVSKDEIPELEATTHFPVKLVIRDQKQGLVGEISVSVSPAYQKELAKAKKRVRPDGWFAVAGLEKMAKRTKDPARRDDK